MNTFNMEFLFMNKSSPFFKLFWPARAIASWVKQIAYPHLAVDPSSISSGKCLLHNLWKSFRSYELQNL